MYSLGPTETIILILIIGGLFAIFMLFLRHDAPFAHSNAFGRHLNFDSYHMDTIVKVLYFFTLLLNMIVALAVMYAGFQSDYEGQNTLAILLIGVLVFAVLQFFSRMLHEAIIMYVHIAQDIRGIRDACGYKRVPASVSVNPAPAQHDATPKPGFAERASSVRNAASRVASAVAFGLASDSGEQPAVAPAALEEVPDKADPNQARAHQTDTNKPWVCNSCGTLVYSGNFCPKCGSPRPNA